MEESSPKLHGNGLCKGNSNHEIALYKPYVGETPTHKIDVY